MSSKWFSYRARWQGMEYACSPEPLENGVSLHLRSRQPANGFDEVEPDVHVRRVLASECDMFAYVTMVCQWRGEPCTVHDERASELLLEYTGGQVPRALELGMDRIERGVYRRWVDRDEVRGLRESTTMLVAPNN